jgi:hypothetical protein
MNKHLFNKSLLTVLSLLLLIACTTPLTAMAGNNSNATLVDEIEIVRRNQQLFLYLHSNAPVVHQSIEINPSHLTLELEQIKLSPTVRTNYLNAPNIDTILIKQLANHKVRLEIDGSDLNEPIIGFRELSGKAIPTVERVGGITLLPVTTPLPTQGMAPATVTSTSTLTKKPSVGVKTTASPSIPALEKEQTVKKAIEKKPLISSKALPSPIITNNDTALPAHSISEEAGVEAPATPVWKTILLQLVMGASHHLDWCAYGLLGTLLLGLLASWGLKPRTRNAPEKAPPLMSIPTPPLAISVPLQQNSNRRPLIKEAKEASPAAHQRILDRVQRQMDGTVASIPSQNPAFQADYKSTPKVPVSQASKQYQQQQNFVSSAKPTAPPVAKLNEATSSNGNNGFNPSAGERSTQKVVRPWQPTAVGNNVPVAKQTASGAAFLEQMNAYLDPASKQNIQQGLRNNQQAL